MRLRCEPLSRAKVCPLPGVRLPIRVSWFLSSKGWASSFAPFHLPTDEWRSLACEGRLEGMSEAMLTIEDAARNLAAVVDRVQAKCEPAVLLKSGRPVARIVPVAAASHVSEDLVAFLRRWRTEHPEPDDELSDIIQESRKWQGPPRDPWGSS
jgi:prevent-host-death family protein